MTEIRKFSAYIPVSRQQLLDAGAVEPTEEERREAEASRADLERRRLLATEAWPIMVEQLAAITDPVSRAVLDLHSADGRGECEGCDFDGYEAESPEWPCRTVATVANLHGIEVHPDYYLAEQYHKWTHD
jgi:hypothetical protein